MKDTNKKSTEVIVNGRVIEVFEKKLSFAEIVKLAFGSYDANEVTVFTVTYSKNEHEKGMLVAGDEITVKKGLIFNVTKTTRS